MTKKSATYYALGLMSGSSLDGLDLAYCRFDFSNNWNFELIESETVPLGKWRDKLKMARGSNAIKLKQLSLDFADFMADNVLHFLNSRNINRLDVVVSHGHTIYHYPDKGITCQIGDGKRMSERLKTKVVCNLRQRDMNLGGQGAPIVPIGDVHLFSDYPICLNIGGIANLSIKLRGGVIAFDVCTANQVLNYYANKLGKEYDDKGVFARSGCINMVLLEKLNALDFYQLPFPKSLDNEFRNELIYLINAFETDVKNALATYTEHIALQLTKVVVNIASKNLLPLSENTRILVTGGGAFNEFLIERIRYHLKIPIVVPGSEIVDFKEAIVMAFIGVLKLRDEINVLASVTGAKQDSCCGELYDYLD